jgi:hypothetical protein
MSATGFAKPRRADAKPLMERLKIAGQRMLAPPEWCFERARRKIKAGHYHHDHDEKIVEP